MRCWRRCPKSTAAKVRPEKCEAVFRWVRTINKEQSALLSPSKSGIRSKTLPGDVCERFDFISDRKCQDRPSSRIEFFIAQTAFEFIRHAGNDTLAEAPASFFINAVKTPYPVVLDRQLYLRTISLKHNSDWPRFFRVSMLQRVKDKLRSHDPIATAASGAV